MRSLGRQAAPGSRRHPPPVCPFHRWGRRSVSNTHVRTPAVQPVATGASVSPPRTRPVQLVWNQPQHQRRRLHNGDDGTGLVPQPLGEAVVSSVAHDRASAIELMFRIKAARSWQQLQSIVDDNQRCMNHLHVSAVVTHMAQLHTSSSSSDDDCGHTAGPGGSRGRGIRDPTDLPLNRGNPSQSHNSRHWADGTAAATQRPSLAAGGAGQARHAAHLQPLSRPATSPASASSSPLPVRSRLSSSAPPGPLPPEREVFLLRLERLVLAHLPDFQGRQLANTLWAVAKVGHRPPRAWLDAVLARVRVQLGTFEPQHLANTLYALMLLQFMPPSPWLVDFFASFDRRLHGFGPAELSQICYAAGKLRLQPGQALLGGILQHSMVNMHAYGMRELTLLLYGVVHMGMSHHQSWMRLYRIRVAELIVMSGAVSPRVLERIGPRLNKPVAALVTAQLQDEHQQQHQHQHTQERNEQGRWQGGPQQHASDAVRHGGEAAQPQGPSYISQPSTSRGAVLSSYLPSVLLSMANMAYQPPPAFLSVVLDLAGSNARELGPVGRTSLLLSLAYMQYRPQPRWFRGVWELVMESLDSLDTQQSANALWAAARLGCSVPRRDVHAFLMQAASRLPEHTDAELQALMQAAALLAFEPRPDWLELLETHQYNRLPHMRPFEAAMALQRLSDLGHKPHRVWLARWAEALLAGVSELSLYDVAVAGHAAAQLGYRPPASLCSELLRVAADHMAVAEAREETPADSDATWPPSHVAWSERQRREVPDGAQAARVPRLRSRNGGAGVRCRCETLSRLLWALAMLDVRPDGDWMASYMACLRSALDDLSARELSLVVWALARLRYDPGSEWMEAFRQRSGDYVAGSSGAGVSASMAGGAGGAEALFAPESHTGGLSPEVLGAAASGVHASLPDGAVAGSSARGPARVRAEDAWTRGGNFSLGLDFSVIILQGLTAWAARQLGDASGAEQQVVGNRR